MRTSVLFCLCLFCLAVSKAQLSGSVFLQGQSNHAGIRAKFTSQGGTAVTDSTYTDASGNYSIMITPGVYKVTFSKPGYVDVFYSNGASALLTNTTVLGSSTLSPGNPVFVSGFISGTWNSSNVYVVTGQVYVPANSTLTILPGTQVLFNGFYTIYGDGIIRAMGTQANPIVFTSGKPVKTRNDWDRIGMKGVGSSFDHCIIEYSYSGLDFQKADVDVTNSIIRHGGAGIYCGAGTPKIMNNEIYDMVGVSFGVWVEGSATGTISCNYIHDIDGLDYSGWGITENASLVKDNRIDNISGTPSMGIVSRYANSRIINNTVSNAGSGIYIDNDWETTFPLIANNTLFSNHIGIQVKCGTVTKWTYPHIVNNLITGGSYGILQSGGCSTFTVENNNVWNQVISAYWGVPIPGIGQMIATNSAGYAVDAFFNLGQDPLFDTPPPLIVANSPCYGSGKSGYASYIGYSSPQTCMGTVLSVKEESPVDLRLFPNPCDGQFFLTTSSLEAKISVLDVQGRLVYEGKTFSGQKIDLSYLSAGVYVVTANTVEGSTTKLLAISK